MTTKKVKPEHGMSTIVNHVGEGGHDKHAHLMPIYQTSTFGFDTVEEAGEVALQEDSFLATDDELRQQRLQLRHIGNGTP